MKHVIVATIGARDVRYKPSGETKFLLGDPRDYKSVAAGLKCEPNLRAITKKIMESIESESICLEQLKIPIINPGLKFVLRRMCEGDDFEFKMIVTDQIPADKSDTIFSGKLIARRVKVPDHKYESIIIRDSPHAHDVVYKEVRKELANINDVDYLWVLPTGGTPAMSEAIRLAGMNLYGKHCRVVQVGRPSIDKTGADQGEASEAKPDPYVQDTIRISAKSLIEHYNYVAALDTLKSHRFDWDTVLMHLLKHAAARVNLDRAAARSEAKYAMDALGKPDEVLKNTLLVPIDDYDVLGFASELRHLINALIQQKRWTDALSRIALFAETCRASFVIGAAFSLSNVSVDYHELMPLIHCYLDKEILSQEIPFSEEIRNLIVAEVCLGRHVWEVKSPKHKRSLYQKVAEDVRKCNLVRWRRLPDRVETLDSLIALRNRSTHVPRGVSKSDFNTAWRESGVPQNVSQYVDGTFDCLRQCFSIDFNGGDPYGKLNERMLRHLQK